MKKFLRFTKIEHTVFSLPLLFAGAWLAAGQQWPSWTTLALIAVAGVGARILGMAMNRYLDRRLDALNPRTANRELPSGQMSPRGALAVAATGLVLYLAACVALGPLCLLLSPIPAAVLIGYSLLKRFTPYCHFGIGATLALAPAGAHVAVAGNLQPEPALVFLAVFTFLWISAFDIIYALQDLEADRRNGVHSLPAFLGSKGAQVVAAAVHVGALASAAGVAWYSGAGLAGWIMWAILGGTLAAAYWPAIPLPQRFFPLSALAGLAGALVPLLGNG
jgi:4-hydroxybenzoate polyprenyltransferase